MPITGEQLERLKDGREMEPFGEDGFIDAKCPECKHQLYWVGPGQRFICCNCEKKFRMIGGILYDDESRETFARVERMPEDLEGYS